MNPVYFSLGKKVIQIFQVLEACNVYINVSLRFVPCRYFKHSEGSTNTSLNDGVKTIERR